jgi:hypothetical protein
VANQNGIFAMNFQLSVRRLKMLSVRLGEFWSATKRMLRRRMNGLGTDSQAELAEGLRVFLQFLVFLAVPNRNFRFRSSDDGSFSIKILNEPKR